MSSAASPKAMGKAETASRNKNVSGAAVRGESRDGGTRAVSFSEDAALLMVCMRELAYTWKETRSSLLAQDLANHLSEALDRFEAGDFDACRKQARATLDFYRDRALGGTIP